MVLMRVMWPSRAYRADRVRARGHLLGAQDIDSNELVGLIIVVPPGGDARRIARGGEAELHLLAVSPSARGRGIGKALVKTAIKYARAQGYTQLVLSTQPQMTAAQGIYTRIGFKRVPERDWVSGDMSFMVYEL